VALLRLAGRVKVSERSDMRKTQSLITLTFLLLWVSGVIAQNSVPDSGVIVEQAPCAPNSVAYEQFLERFKERQTQEVEAAKREGITIEADPRLISRLPSKDEYERRRAYTGFECRRIKYLSNGLKVVGYIWKPTKTTGKKLPLIIYNRGGNREFAKLMPWMHHGFYDFVSNGFVVIGSQYRGNDGGEGHEEFGGADVHDVLNLIPLAKSLGYVDMSNVFMFGESRGGMMAYLALTNNMPVNAVATIGGAVDLITGGKERSRMVTNYQELIPDFSKRSEESLRERSVIYWPEKINTPLLLIQGNADWRGNPSHTLTLAQKLQGLGKAYELIVYSGDNHGVAYNRDDAHRRIIEWFKRYMK
jgi:dipeptidyl aminopeptidase/acylaminoacyl peptidase